MREAKDVVDQFFLEMRWRCLSLAADLDRIERARNGRTVMAADPRLATLREAIKVLLDERPNRAEQVQMLFSDRTPPPPTANSNNHGRRAHGAHHAPQHGHHNTHAQPHTQPHTQPQQGQHHH